MFCFWYTLLADNVYENILEICDFLKDFDINCSQNILKKVILILLIYKSVLYYPDNYQEKVFSFVRLLSLVCFQASLFL